MNRNRVLPKKLGFSVEMWLSFTQRPTYRPH